MSRRLVLLLVAFAAASASAQFSLDTSPKVTIEGAVTSRNGDAIEGVIIAKVADGWHINSHTPTFDYAIPTALAFTDGAELTSAAYPQHKMQSFAFTEGKPIAVYEHTFQIPFKGKLKSGAQNITADLRYQACNDSVCLPPNNAKVVFGLVEDRRLSSTAFTPLSEAPKNPTRDKLAETFASKGLPLTLGLLFLGGLALNLTPCVLPLIPITLGFFAMQSDGRRSRRFALSSMYVLGLVVMYSALGVMAAIGGKLFGAWLQLPAVLIGFAILMLVLASSMFGAFEIQPPRWIANRSQGRAGLAGAAAMGLVVGIVAAPCVGPVVISLLTLVAQLGDPVVGGAMFAALAFGLGFPYLALLNVFPKPGEWMVQVKKAMGFVLVAMAFYFLRPLTGDEVYRWGVAISLLVGAVFLFASRGTAGRALRLACASLLLVAGAAFAIPRGETAGVQWSKYDVNAISAASAQKRPVVIDFYADWCLPCKELDAKTFSDPAVIAEMNRFVRIKADLTLTNDEKTQALTKQYAILGVPTIVFIDSSGREVTSARLTGYEPPAPFLERLKKVR